MAEGLQSHCSLYALCHPYEIDLKTDQATESHTHKYGCMCNNYNNAYENYRISLIDRGFTLIKRFPTCNCKIRQIAIHSLTYLSL